MGFLGLLPLLEPSGLYRPDGKPSDGATMIPREMGKDLVWNVTVVDVLAPSRLNQGSLDSSRTPTADAESGRTSGERSEMFSARLCKMLFRSHDHQ